MFDRSSTPHSIPHRTPEQRVTTIAALRRLRLTAAEIALSLPMALLDGLRGPAAGSGSASSPGSSRPSHPTATSTAHPGELVHIDVKKLGRIAGVGHRFTGRAAAASPHDAVWRVTGWEYVHVCVDDATRLAYVEVLAVETAPPPPSAFSHRARLLRRNGIRVERVMTDNGSAYRRPCTPSPAAPSGIRHLRTHPYRPRTNGKAERFIRTLLGSWAYAAFTPPTPNAPPLSTAGSGPTTIADLTAPSTTSRPSPAYAS